MTILTRYILLEMIKVFVLTLVSMTAIVFLVLVGKEAVENGLGIVPIVRMLPYILPQAMQFAVPGTMLLAATSVYGRMSGDNEIVATKSLGISPWSLVSPTLVLATLVSFGSVALNNIAVSWGRIGVERVLTQSAEEIVYGMLHTKRAYKSGRLHVRVQGVEGRKLIQPIIVLNRSEGKPPTIIRARTAELNFSFAENELVIELSDSEFDGDIHGEHPGDLTKPITIPLDDFFGRSHKPASPSACPLDRIQASIREEREAIEQIKREMSFNAACAMMTGDFERIGQTPAERYQARLRHKHGRIHRLYTEPPRRWANGFSCLSFVILGVPMAIRRRHSEFLASFFACFLPILILYYPLLMFSVDQAKDGQIPPSSVWLGNIVLGVLGVWMMRRVMRY